MIDKKSPTTSALRQWFGIAIGLAILTVPMFATTVARLSLEQLVKKSDLIVQGGVQSVYSQWDEAHRLVFTYVSIRVDESLKGERRPSLLIRQVGGTVGTINMSVAGVPQFKSGETAILFLKRQVDGTFQVAGMNQGLYKVVDNFAVTSTLGVDLLDTATGVISRPLIGSRAPLEQLKSRIREFIQ